MDNLIYIALIILCGLYIHLWMSQAKINIELEVNKEFRKLFSESSCTHADAIMKSHNQIKTLIELATNQNDRINNLSEVILKNEARLETVEGIQATKEQLEKCEHSLMKVACFETHGENKYISHEQAYTGVANFARQYFKQKDEVKCE